MRSSSRHTVRLDSTELAICRCEWREKTKTHGLITGRTGDTFTIKTGDRNVTVVINRRNQVQKPKGLGLRKTQMSFTALIPGLKISVDGVRDEQNRIAANTITFFRR